VVVLRIGRTPVSLNSVIPEIVTVVEVPAVDGIRENRNLENRQDVVLLALIRIDQTRVVEIALDLERM
jgi:regulator of PEP synthase PpsR (kinase-PPPase family)